MVSVENMTQVYTTIWQSLCNFYLFPNDREGHFIHVLIRSEILSGFDSTVTSWKSLCTVTTCYLCIQLSNKPPSIYPNWIMEEAAADGIGREEDWVE